MRQESEIGDSVLVVFHDHVYTAGIRFKETDIADQQTKVIRLNRGGSITYHGPGQINIYPIINIEEKKLTLRSYMLSLHRSVEQTLKSFLIDSESLTGDHLGTWVNGKKVCSYGVSVQKGVTGHGLSLNVRTDMDYFGRIRPCGFPSEVMGRIVDIDESIPGNEVIANILREYIIRNLEIDNYIMLKTVSSLQALTHS